MRIEYIAYHEFLEKKLMVGAEYIAGGQVILNKSWVKQNVENTHRIYCVPSILVDGMGWLRLVGSLNL